MRMKKLRQKVAVLLIAALALANVLPVLGASTVEQVGDKSGKKDSISVTFKTDEEYGYWEETDKASTSNISRASSSNVKKVTEKKVTFTKLQEDDEGNSFVTFADEETRELVQKEVLSGLVKSSEDSELFVNGWYSEEDQLLITENSKIQIYNHATLTARWSKPDQVKNEDEIPLEAVGLLPDQKLTVQKAEDLTGEGLKNKIDKLFKEAYEFFKGNKLEQSLAKKGYMLENNAQCYGIQIGIENLNEDQDVTYFLDFLEGSMLNPEQEIIAVYLYNIISEGSEWPEYEFMPVDIIRNKDGTAKQLRFKQLNDVSSGLNTVYFVNVQRTEGTSKVKIENVKNGYIRATIYTDRGTEYIPIDEEVILENGTILMLSAYGYNFSDANWKGKLESWTVTPSVGEPITKIEDDWNYIVNGDCTISAVFSQEIKEKEEETEKKEDSENEYRFEDYISSDAANADDLKIESYLSVDVNPGIITGGKYEGDIIVSMWDDNEKVWKTIDDCQVRIATKEDFRKFSVDWENSDNDSLLFECKDGKLISKGELTAREKLYRVPIVVNYNGKDEFARYRYTRKSDNEGMVGTIGAFISVGGRVDFLLPFVLVNGIFDSRASFYIDHSDWISLNKKWGEFDFSNIRNRGLLYGYERVGWQDEEQVVYTDDVELASKLKSKFRTRLYVYARYVKDGKVYQPPEALYDGKEVEIKPEEDNKTHQTYSGGGGSSSGGSSKKDYTMSGTWIADGTLWKFKKDSGEYAANCWGLIRGYWYYFNSQGYMVTGWIQVNNQWYYFIKETGSNEGKMVTGWLLDNDYHAWFYLSESGAMVTGWKQIGSQWYYFQEVSDGRKGAMAENTYVDQYYVGSDGAWIEGMFGT